MSDVLEFETMTLAHGAHGSEFCGEACLVEMSNLIAAQRVRVPDAPRCPLTAVPFTDDHPSISRVVRAFAVGLNDAWNDEDRQRLKPYAVRILCTATTPEDEETRAWMATDWLVRVHTPAFLRLAKLDDHARALESLARITDATLAENAQPTVDAARSASAAAWDAAGAAARAAARAAAGDAAGAAAGAAAWDAAGAEAWDAAGAAARAAARAAAWGAARAAAWDALAPTVALLQSSALELLDDMIAVGRIDREPSA